MARGGARPGAGRKRIDPALKALKGTARADREVAVADEPAAAAGQDLIPPLHLSETARTYFRDIAALLGARVDQAFAPVIALLAQRLEQIHRWQAVLETEGDTFTSKSVSRSKDGKTVFTSMMVRARPEVAMLDSAMRQAQSLLGELMLNPSAALRLMSGKGAPKDDDFDDF